MNDAVSYFEDLMRSAQSSGLPGMREMIPGTGPLAESWTRPTALASQLAAGPQPAAMSPYVAAQRGDPERPAAQQGSPLDDWLQARQRQEAFRGIGSAIDQLGSAFDQRLQNIVIPQRPNFQWRPNINPGIAGMVQQLLLSSSRY